MNKNFNLFFSIWNTTCLEIVNYFLQRHFSYNFFLLWQNCANWSPSSFKPVQEPTFIYLFIFHSIKLPCTDLMPESQTVKRGLFRRTILKPVAHLQPSWESLSPFSRQNDEKRRAFADRILIAGADALERFANTYLLRNRKWLEKLFCSIGWSLILSK